MSRMYTPIIVLIEAAQRIGATQAQAPRPLGSDMIAVEVTKLTRKLLTSECRDHLRYTRVSQITAEPRVTLPPGASWVQDQPLAGTPKNQRKRGVRTAVYAAWAVG